MILQAQMGVKGFFRYQIRNKFSGKIRVDTGFIPNSITITGKNRMGEYSDWFNYAQVGTDNTTPAPTDTGLLAWFAGKQGHEFYARGAQSSPPYFG